MYAAESLNALHDLDPASGGHEMNALLSLVLSMGQNRVAGALRVDSIHSPSQSESDDSDADEGEVDDDDDNDNNDDDDDPGGAARLQVTVGGCPSQR